MRLAVESEQVYLIHIDNKLIAKIQRIFTKITKLKHGIVDR